MVHIHQPKRVKDINQINFVTTIFIFTAITVKILKIGTPEIITIIVLQLKRLDFTVQHCVQNMQTK